MTKTVLKRNLHEAIEQIEDDGFLQAVYKIISTKVEEEEGFVLSPVHKKLLDEREASHKKGLGKSYSWQDAKKEIRKSVKK